MKGGAGGHGAGPSPTVGPLGQQDFGQRETFWCFELPLERMGSRQGLCGMVRSPQVQKKPCFELKQGVED